MAAMYSALSSSTIEEEPVVARAGDDASTEGPARPEMELDPEPGPVGVNGSADERAATFEADPVSATSTEEPQIDEPAVHSDQDFSPGHQVRYPSSSSAGSARITRGRSPPSSGPQHQPRIFDSDTTVPQNPAAVRRPSEASPRWRVSAPPGTGPLPPPPPTPAQSGAWLGGGPWGNHNPLVAEAERGRRRKSLSATVGGSDGRCGFDPNEGGGGYDDQPRPAAVAVPARGGHGRTMSASSCLGRTRSYGTPEMPRGNANLPHVPPESLQPRVGTVPRGQAAQPMHLPRAEKLPLTGYELLAANLSAAGAPRAGSCSGSASSSPVLEDGHHHHHQYSNLKPVYRRFEALNHRLLLHLQDELAELEEQLRRLDTAETQTRRMQGYIMPASRRKESLAGGELQLLKADTLAKIGLKLGQYNHVLSTFQQTQALPKPAMSEVDAYRAFLAVHNPITDDETRFLDPFEDLVSLSSPHHRSNRRNSGDSAVCDVTTPRSNLGRSGRSLVRGADTRSAETEARMEATATQQRTTAPLPLGSRFARAATPATGWVVALVAIAFLIPAVVSSSRGDSVWSGAGA